MSRTTEIADQLKSIKKALSYGANPENLRKDPAYKDVWLTAKHEAIAVNAMELSHMCFTLGLWLRKEFENNEKIRLGLMDPDHCSNGLANPYATKDDWLTTSCSMRDTPALKTMLARIRTIRGGEQLLHTVLTKSAAASLENVHARVTIDQLTPVFF